VAEVFIPRTEILALEEPMEHLKLLHGNRKKEPFRLNEVKFSN
jgi:hypothetical protein